MLIGHSHIWNFLARSVANNRLAHAYLFSGPAGVGKKKLAVEFAKVIQCENFKASKANFSACDSCLSCRLVDRQQHPDTALFENPALVKLTGAESEKDTGPVRTGEMKIEQIRQLQHQLSLTPFYRGKKIVIVNDVDRMTVEAANCLLKTLEEPPQKSLLLLISSDTSRLLSTIISRCQVVRFRILRKELIEEGLGHLGFRDKARNEQAAKFSCGRPGVAINLSADIGAWSDRHRQAEEFGILRKKDMAERFRFAQKLSQDIPGARDVLSGWTIFLRDQILTAAGAGSLAVYGFTDQANKSAGNLTELVKILKKIQETRYLLNDSAFNSRLMLENLMLQV